MLRIAIGFLLLHPIRPGEWSALDVKILISLLALLKFKKSVDSDGSLKSRKNKKAYEIPLHPEWDTSCLHNRFGKEISFPNRWGKRFDPDPFNEA